MQKPPEIVLIAGEASGDVLGAELISELRQQCPALHLSFMGGSNMAASGAQLLVDSRQLAVMGIVNTLCHLRVIRKAYLKIKNYLQKHQPALIILIDYPGFNLRIAKVAHRLGIKVLYYVSPKIWASRYKRIHSIRRYVDHMVVFFKFEEVLYQREGVPVTLVTHPLTRITELKLDTKLICQEINVDPNKTIIGLLPGSRPSEISRLTPLLCSTKKLIQQSIPDAQFVLPLASSTSHDEIQKFLNNDPDIRVVQRPAYEVLSVCQAAIVASGTATLEAALARIPLVIVYKGWEYRVVKHLIKTPYVGLCNIAAQQMVVKELIEYTAKPEIVAEETLKLLQDQTYRQTILKNFERMKEQLGHAPAAKTVAQLAIKMIS